MSRFERSEAAVGMALLAAIVVLVFVAAIMRRFGHPLIWSVDMAQLLFVWVTFIGADLALRRKAHIGMDLLVRPAPPRFRLALELALALVVVVFLGVLVVMGVELTQQNPERQFGDSGISYAFVTAAVPAGCLLLATTICWKMVALVLGRLGTREYVFTDEDHSEVEDRI